MILLEMTGLNETKNRVNLPDNNATKSNKWKKNQEGQNLANWNHSTEQPLIKEITSVQLNNTWQ